MNVWLMILIGWAAVAAVMAVLWLVQRRLGDAGIVDVAWSLGVGVLAVFFATGASEGAVWRRVLVALLAAAWALRLGTHILLRVLRSPEDGRYRELKEQWGAAAQRNLFWFYQAQAVGAVLFALPMFVASRNNQPPGWLDALGVAVWLVALSGEVLADRQLARFRADPAASGRVCRRGLWRYSRHPNYFFEWLHWWAWVCFAVGAPWGWLTALAPLVMLYLIVFVTGIPPTERQALRSRGDAYREYQRTTSAFVPWFPKHRPSEHQPAASSRAA